MTLKIGESLAAGSSFEVDAAVSSTTPASPDPNASNDTASVVSTVQRSADLSVSQSDDVDPVLAGDAVTYTVVATNNGPGSANDVVVTDTLSGDGALQYVYSDVGYCQWVADNSYSCNVGTLSAPGGNGPSTATITAYAVGSHAGTMQNDAAITSDDPDPATGNNDSTESTTVNEAFADLGVTGEASAPSVQADSTLDYTFTITNNGPDRAKNPTMSIHFGRPIMVTYASSTSGYCYGSGQDVQCQLDVLPSGTGAVATVTITPVDPGPLTSHAQVSGAETDTNSSNDAADVNATVTPERGVQYVDVTDHGFDPATVTAKQGQTVQWNFVDLSGNPHSVADGTAMGLFSSGGYGGYQVNYYRYRVTAAGRYKVHDQYGGFDGVIRVPLKVKPGAGGVSTGFKLTWATGAPPAGFVFDVQVKRPGTNTWVYWKNDTTLWTANFIPDAGPGTYRFRSRLRRVSNGAATGWSGAKAITVT